MTESNDQRDHGRLDENLDRLLTLGEPAPGMPDDLKTRIRSRLEEVKPEAAGRRAFPARWAGWTMAAAAVLAFLLVVFWPGGSSAAISWANVLEQLEQIRTVSARTVSETTAPTGEKTSFQCNIYFKDPGCSRTERLGPDDTPQSINITNGTQDRTDFLMLDADREHARWSTFTFRSDCDEIPDRLEPDFVAKGLERLRSITYEEANRIGDRVIGGAAAIGFEAPVRDIFGSDDRLGGKGLLRIWVSRENAVPLLIELEFQNPMTGMVKTTIYDIEWNAALEDHLFELVVPVDWQLNRMTADIAEYCHTGLASHVTLAIGPQGGDSLARAADVSAVVKAEQATRQDPSVPRSLRVTLELAAEAARRLHDFTAAHPQALLEVNFNGQLNVVPHLEKENEPANHISFDLSLLGISLAELEATYFTTDEQEG